MALENVVGNLKVYSQLEKGTFQHGDQLQAERLEKPESQDQWFYTADGHGYFLREDGGIDWAITREDENLVLRHIDDEVDSSYHKLVNERNYRPDNAEAQAAKDTKSTVVVDMGKLRLSGDEKEFRYLQIRPKDGFIKTEDGYQSPNEEEQKAMTRLGYTSQTLKLMHDSHLKIRESKIHVLNPEYVAEEAPKDPEHNSLWRASWLLNFNDDSLFFALSRSVYYGFSLRGVRRVIAAGDVKNEVS